MSLVISEISNSEIETVIALWQRCELTRPWNDAKRDIEFAIQSENATVLVGKQVGAIIACVMVGHDGHRGAIYYLAVDPAHQSRGHGWAIHEAATAWLKSKGIWKINLMFRSENSKVRGFYERLGYAVNDVVSLGKKI
jgi:ribosomal protein S18 acetylase RimI-like enzyme